MSGILSRWSRRKLAQTESAGPVVEPVVADAPDDLPEEPVIDEAALLEELGLPDPDTLTKGDDFAAFLRTAVPEALRRRALRRLWRSDPALACLDGLNDYDADYRAVSDGTVMQSAYRAGLGFAKGAVRDMAAPVAPPDAKVAAVPPAPAPPAPGPEVPPTDADAIASADPASLPDPASDADAAAPPPRRMKFTI